MAYDEKLAERIRKVLARHEGLAEKKMFGGIAFTVAGNMVCGVAKDELMVRVGPQAYETALAQPHARPMDFTGRPLRGMVFVRPDGHRTDEALEWWLSQGLKFALSLPARNY